MTRWWPTTRRRRPQQADGGFTLVEFIVAMGLFAALIAIFMVGITNMTRYTIQGENSEENADEARRIYAELNRQVREADAINAVSTNAGRWYLEFSTTSVAAGSNPLCTQWRFDPTNGRIALRTFPNLSTPTATAWMQFSDGMVANSGGVAPVVMLPADSTHTRQRLQVTLTLQRGGTRASQLNTVFVARNSSINSTTNTLTSGGLSQTTVCRQLGQP
jgi:prepilin-type N-terminal cleavage/methylation domain-containing protein